MQPSDKAFDRVKSLLGKLDRSIDDARRRRLTEDEEPDPRRDHTTENGTQTVCDRMATPSVEAAETPKPAARTDSKYGRARPIRDLSDPSQATWQRV